jgi:hypothetical protein
MAAGIPAGIAEESGVRRSQLKPEAANPVIIVSDTEHLSLVFGIPIFREERRSKTLWLLRGALGYIRLESSFEFRGREDCL